MELASATVHKSGNSLHVSHGDDKGLYVTFYNEAIEIPYESEVQGHPVFKDVPHVHILFPGDRTKEVKRPVKLSGDESSPSDAVRWPSQWAAFKNQSEVQNSGMPITEWPPLTKGMALSLKSMNIHTVEALASVPDHALTWLGARELRDKAKVFLECATDSAAVLKLQSENETLKQDIEQLKQQFASLSKKRKTPAEETA